MTEDLNQNPETNSKVYTLYYAFFLIPLMVTMLGVMFFFMFKVLTYETNTPLDYLNDVQYGAATKRWQSAYELSKILSENNLDALNDGFHQRMIAVYEHRLNEVDDAKKIKGLQQLQAFLHVIEVYAGLVAGVGGIVDGVIEGSGGKAYGGATALAITGSKRKRAGDQVDKALTPLDE